MQLKVILEMFKRFFGKTDWTRTSHNFPEDNEWLNEGDACSHDEDDFEEDIVPLHDNVASNQRYAENPSGTGKTTHLHLVTSDEDRTIKAGLAASFYLRRDGYYHVQPQRDKDTIATFVCAPFTLDYGVYSLGAMYYCMTWVGPNGSNIKSLVPAGLQHSGGALAARFLSDRGLHCSATRQGHQYLAQLLNEQVAPRWRTALTRAGWHKLNGQHLYALSGVGVIGPGNEDFIYDIDLPGCERDASHSAGTLQQWQDNVSRFAVGNSRLAFLTCAALAAVMLNPLGLDSGGFHLYGSSSLGKTTILKVVASLWGRPTHEGSLRTWYQTSNGLEAQAALSCDGPLCLDEISQASGKEVGKIVYMLSNGSGKGRATPVGGARPIATWRGQVLSSGELTLSAKITEEGGRYMAGQDVRVVSVPADAGSGCGAFEELHGFESAEKFVGYLNKAVMTSYGTVAEEFISLIAECRNLSSGDEQISDGFQVRMADFNAQAGLGAGADGQVLRVAAKFGMVAAIGEILLGYGLLPWPAGESMRAALACFRSWLDERPAGVASYEADAGLTAVTDFLFRHSNSRFQAIGADGALHTLTIRDQAGFIDERNIEQKSFVIWPDVFKTQICAGHDYRMVARTLIELGYMGRADGKHLARKIRLPGWETEKRMIVISADIIPSNPLPRRQEDAPTDLPM